MDKPELSHSTEAQYDPRLFMLFATDPEFFRTKLPPIITEVADMSDSMVSTPLLEQQKKVARDLIQEAPERILHTIYKGFASEQRIEKVKKEVLPGFEMDLYPSIEDLPEKEANQWRTYLDTAELPRDVALKGFKDVLAIFGRLPSVKYAFDPSVEHLDRKIQSAAYELTLSFFPDITDQEVKDLFGQTETVESIRQEANPESQVLGT